MKLGLNVAKETCEATGQWTRRMRLLGDVYLASGRLDEAEKMAEDTMRQAQISGEQAEIAACYRIYGQLEKHKGNADEARVWFEKAIELFGLIKSRYELAITRYVAATSGLYDNGTKATMLYLAREYFEAEDVKIYVERIDAELKVSAKPIESRSPGENSTSGDYYQECPTIIAANHKMREILSFAQRVARSELTVLITGPTGAGKDLLARYVHYHSGRKGHFVSINAAAIPLAMVESELFGHTKGAFTGAQTDRIGLFELADGGTFYLNEIADAPPEFQAKLLEVLETRAIRRLGENRQKLVDFRLIAATNHDLQKQMESGAFRTDLFHRLDQIPIKLPELSERLDEIPALVEYFLRVAGVDASTTANQRQIEKLCEVLSKYSWAGNVRQLRSEISYLLLTGGRDLKEMTRLARTKLASTSEHARLMAALKAANGNKSEAARSLGLKESTFRYRLKKTQSP